MSAEVLATESIAEMIERLCPDGVEHKKISEVFNVVKAPKGLPRSKFQQTGKYAVVDQGQEPIAGYTNEEKHLEGQFVIFGDHTRMVKWVDFPFVVGADGVKVLEAAEGVDAKYAFFALANAKIADLGYSRHWKIVQDTEIPLPPSEVQREIVNCLDQFSSLHELLDAEVIGREKQLPQLQSEWLRVGSFEELGNLVEFSKTRVKTEDIDPEDYTGVENLLQNLEGRVSGPKLPAVESVTKVEPNDVLLGNIRPYLKKAWLADRAGGASNDVLVLRVKEDAQEKLDPAWLFYVVTSEEFLHYNIANSKGAKMPRGDKKAILKYQLPLPPLDAQQQTAKDLDAFTNYINNLKRERELRQKQYAGLREKLLVFPKKETA